MIPRSRTPQTMVNSRILNKTLFQQEIMAKSNRSCSSTRKSSAMETEKGMPEKRVTTHITRSSSCLPWSKLRKTGLIGLTVCPAQDTSAAWMVQIIKPETTVWSKDSSMDICCRCLREELQIRCTANSSRKLQLTLNCNKGSLSTRVSWTPTEAITMVLAWFLDKVIKMVDQFR